MKLLVFLVRIYQKTVSPQTGVLKFIYSSPVFCLFPNIRVGCKNYPRCSDYCIESVSKYGVLKGTVMTIKRIVECK